MLIKSAFRNNSLEILKKKLTFNFGQWPNLCFSEIEGPIYKIIKK